MKRPSKKIDAPHFLAVLCPNPQTGSPSYNDLASSFHATYDTMASKQAFWKKVNDSCVTFSQLVLARIIQTKLSGYHSEKNGISKKFKKAIVQDSTIIKLPLRLFKVFPGVCNATSSVCNARIQAAYDLISGNSIYFSIGPYSKNDLLAAPGLEIQKGGLILRDRGYSSYSEIRRHIKESAFCIYRHKFKSIYIGPSTGGPFNLRTALIKNERLDIELGLNDKERTRIRSVAAPVSQEIAGLRRVKAKKEMKGRKPSEEVLFLMSWTVFITNIPMGQVSFGQILETYRLRWRIGNIFKIWKSYICFNRVHNVSENQLKVWTTARLLMIVITIQLAYQPCCLKVKCIHNRHLSMMKTIKYFMVN